MNMYEPVGFWLYIRPAVIGLHLRLRPRIIVVPQEPLTASINDRTTRPWKVHYVFSLLMPAAAVPHKGNYMKVKHIFASIISTP